MPAVVILLHPAEGEGSKDGDAFFEDTLAMASIFLLLEPPGTRFGCMSSSLNFSVIPPMMHQWPAVKLSS